MWIHSNVTRDVRRSFLECRHASGHESLLEEPLREKEYFYRKTISMQHVPSEESGR